MKNSLVYIVSLFLLFSCSQPKPRKPVSHASGYDQSESIAFNKKMYEQESSLIKSFIDRDSLHSYINSKYGFWYAYEIEKKNDSIFPVKGNTVVLNYDIHDFNGNEIYSLSDIGTKNYRVDQEEMIQGLREGIKWMNEGEKIIFLLPSHNAFAYHGDENKIGPNTPIIVTLELIDIKK